MKNRERKEPWSEQMVQLFMMYVRVMGLVGGGIFRCFTTELEFQRELLDPSLKDKFLFFPHFDGKFRGYPIS